MGEEKDVPVVILAGGLGLRMRDYSEHLPKALVPIGNMVVIHHVMNIYAYQGFNRFILCLGYKGEMIKEHFTNLRIKTKGNFDIAFVDTGVKTQTGGRIKAIEKYVGTDNFFVTYCDGLADINLKALLDHHLAKKRLATVTVVHPMSPFGIVDIEDGMVKSFKEKPVLPGFINGGFFVFNKNVFEYLDENSVLEEEPLRKLARDDQLAAYHHEGFWSCMDTYKDVDRLNKLWETGFMPNVSVNFNKAPWKFWED